MMIHTEKPYGSINFSSCDKGKVYLTKDGFFLIDNAGNRMMISEENYNLLKKKGL